MAIYGTPHLLHLTYWQPPAPPSDRTPIQQLVRLATPFGVTTKLPGRSLSTRVREFPKPGSLAYPMYLFEQAPVEFLHPGVAHFFQNAKQLCKSKDFESALKYCELGLQVVGLEPEKTRTKIECYFLIIKAICCYKIPFQNEAACDCFTQLMQKEYALDNDVYCWAFCMRLRILLVSKVIHLDEENFKNFNTEEALIKMNGHNRWKCETFLTLGLCYRYLNEIETSKHYFTSAQKLYGRHPALRNIERKLNTPTNTSS